MDEKSDVYDYRKAITSGDIKPNYVIPNKHERQKKEMETFLNTITKLTEKDKEDLIKIRFHKNKGNKDDITVYDIEKRINKCKEVSYDERNSIFEYIQNKWLDDMISLSVIDKNIVIGFGRTIIKLKEDKDREEDNKKRFEGGYHQKKGWKGVRAYFLLFCCCTYIDDYDS